MARQTNKYTITKISRNSFNPALIDQLCKEHTLFLLNNTEDSTVFIACNTNNNRVSGLAVLARDVYTTKETTCGTYAIESKYLQNYFNGTNKRKFSVVKDEKSIILQLEHENNESIIVHFSATIPPDVWQSYFKYLLEERSTEVNIQNSKEISEVIKNINPNIWPLNSIAWFLEDGIVITEIDSSGNHKILAKFKYTNTLNENQYILNHGIHMCALRLYNADPSSAIIKIYAKEGISQIVFKNNQWIFTTKIQEKPTIDFAFTDLRSITIPNVEMLINFFKLHNYETFIFTAKDTEFKIKNNDTASYRLELTIPAVNFEWERSVSVDGQKAAALFELLAPEKVAICIGEDDKVKLLVSDKGVIVMDLSPIELGE